MGFTQALSNELLDQLLGQEAMTLNDDPLYIGLSTTTPTSTGGSFTEPSGNNYSRKSVDNNLTEWPAASAGSKSNANVQSFDTASGSWGTCTHWGLFTASSGGTPILWGALTTPKTPGSGDTLKFQASALVVSIA